MGVRQQRTKFYEELVEDLCAFAEREFRDQRRLSDGASERDHLDSARRQFEKLGKKSPKALTERAKSGPSCPQKIEYLWHYFLELTLGLAVSGMATPVVTWEGLLSWCQLRGIALVPWEALALVHLSALRAAVFAEKDSAKTDARKNKD